MIINEIITEDSDHEIRNYKKLDKILVKLCKMVVNGQKANPDMYGVVAAAVLDTDNRVIAGLNTAHNATDTRKHAERVAIEKYQAAHGDIPKGSIIITTCSPCSEEMAERFGDSCTQLINAVGLKKVYCGFIDPSQEEENRDFNIMETENEYIRDLCKTFAKEFLDDSDLTEVFNPETSFPIEWDDRHGPKEMHGRAYDRQGGFIDIKFIALRNDVVEVEFSRNDSYDMTGAGDANRVLATILEAFREYLRGYRPKIFVFSAKGGSRSRVYQSMIQRFAAGAGYKQFDTAKLSDKARKQLGHSGSDVMVLRRAAVTEAFDKPYAFNWSRGDHGDYDVFVKLPDGSPLNIAFNREGDDGWHVAFDRGHSQEITGEGDAQRIFATVLTSIQQFILKEEPDRLYFSASKDVEPGQNPTSRASLYERMVRRYARSLGYDVVVDDRRGHTMFVLDKDQSLREESFNGIDIDMDIEGDEIMVKAMANGRELGHVLFVDEGEYLMPQDLEVDERFQGQGIAAAMYDYVKSKGYKIRRSGQQTDAGAGFWDKHRPEQNVWENFADGKVKGKSRPGRVKRAGASCNGSITDLRARARKASGERAKMYHWCANMKSGRKK